MNRRATEALSVLTSGPLWVESRGVESGSVAPLGFQIEAEANLRILPITAPLAIHAAELRRRYYSKKNAFSYNDGLYLASGLAEHADLIITTDPHLLGVTELKSILPSQYR